MQLTYFLKAFFSTRSFLFWILLFWNCFFRGFCKSAFILWYFSCYKVSFLWFLTDLFSEVWIMRRLSIKRTTKWFEYQCYMVLFVASNHVIGIISLLVVCNLKVWSRCSVLKRALQFMKIQSTYCLYLQSILEFFD